ncbi:hypothetical protein L198_02632 [Cryptococcus wingfieldii CBS 7118]|uniref:Peptidase A1 domain-containing protein n=1 Tax=Cryptococcus wingfieldii CBS 7118 TaxID=1295528 RepID=A0A1E3JM56_9TREE|nr:hypothetical protein L198_02632 [Cryptococcus wingfieldii CBS 7118]ODO01903.1 hypothetical protein L198_02632 [Cryptococcus wingfieldii CBS 7118]
MDSRPAVRRPRATKSPQRRVESKLAIWERISRRQDETNSVPASSSWSSSEVYRAAEVTTVSGSDSSSASDFTTSYDPSATSYTAYNATNALSPYSANSTESLTKNATITSTSTCSSSSSSARTSSRSSCTKSTRTTTFTSLWSTSKSKTATGTASAATSTKSAYVPGVMLNMTMSGDSDTQAVYGVEVEMGHDDDDGKRKRKRGIGWGMGRRASYAKDWKNQMVNLQVDLGSSDMWVAVKECSTSDCNSAPTLFNEDLSLDSDTTANITYQTGAVDGTIYWEQLNVGDFSIGYQAFIAATAVTNENLKGGNFSGVLGLSLPAASSILAEIGGTTGSNPDGATFLDNLFGAGSSAPSERLFALSLSRREDVRTLSTFGIGATSPLFCPSPCSPHFVPIVAQPSLGSTGYTHWRVQIQSLSVTTWSDEKSGTGATTSKVALGNSKVYSTKGSPLAVLDSGGVQILVGSRNYAEQIYGAIGVSMSSDGLYRLPCSKQIALAFNIGGVDIPVHPLDMSYVDPSDLGQSTCIGMVQYSSNLGDSGDFILGSTFMKNVYSIFKYPDTQKHVTWQPTVGLIPLTNASIASQDFYSVRVLHESLSTVSTTQATNAGGSGVYNPGSGTGTGSGSAESGKKASSTAIIAASSVGGFFVLVVVAFCAWWFFLRRKFGATGSVPTPDLKRRPSTSGHKSDHSMSTLRSKKHDYTNRQKSIIDGYKDWDGDEWVSGTEGGDSIRLGYIPEALEEGDDEGRQTRAVARSSRSLTVRSSSHRSRSIAEEPGMEEAALVDHVDPTKSPTTPFADPLPESPQSDSFPLHPSNGPYPSPIPIHQSASSHSKSPSMSMSGPFPSSPGPTGMARYSTMRLDSSPMYDIRTSDYFTIAPAPSTAQRGRRGSSGVLGGEGAGHRRASPSKASGKVFFEESVKEESEGGS